MKIWEELGGEYGDYTYRMKVPGGWIVRNTVSYGSQHPGVSISTHMIFIEDRDHTWEIEK